MKDYRDLFGGMAGAVMLMLAYLLAFGAAQKCFGAEIKRIAPDGANEITLDVDGNGYVTGQKSTCLHVAERYLPQSGERVMVGDFEYVLVSYVDWERWTNAVARLEAVAERKWKKEHETADGRRAWHGNHTNRVVSADGRSVTWFYPDGYTYVEEVKAAPRRSPAVSRQTAPPRPQNAPKRTAGTGLPPRLRAKREAIEARPAAREVNVTFGVGGKVLNVEGVK